MGCCAPFVYLENYSSIFHTKYILSPGKHITIIIMKLSSLENKNLEIQQKIIVTSRTKMFLVHAFKLCANENK